MLPIKTCEPIVALFFVVVLNFHNLENRPISENSKGNRSKLQNQKNLYIHFQIISKQINFFLNIFSGPVSLTLLHLHTV